MLHNLKWLLAPFCLALKGSIRISYRKQNQKNVREE
jgi:hypothetical protein